MAICFGCATIFAIVFLRRCCVEDCNGYSSPTSLLLELYWLPVNKRINFKITALAYQSLAFGQPNYLSSVLTPHQHHRSLRSVNQNFSSVHLSSFGQSFSYCAPKIWNDIIPLSVKQSPSLDSFKCSLKTHHFANN